MLTSKQESFCLAYIENGNASEAYRLTYNAEKMKPETVNRSAKELLDNTKITARIEEIRRPALEVAQVTLAEHLKDLKKLRDLSESEGKFSAAVSAEIARGKVSGLYVQKVELTGQVGLADRLARAEARLS